MTQGDEQSRQARSDQPPSAVYKAWALCDYWSLSDAIRLLYAAAPQPPGLEEEEALPRQAGIVEAVAQRCAGGSLPVTELVSLPGRLCVRPRDFLDWADLKSIEVPGELRMAVDAVAPLTGGGGRPERKLSPTQRRREMSRAIAALLWREYPQMTIEAMAERPEIHEIGCEGAEYAHKTIRDWIKTEAPNRKPGRRPSTSKTPV